MYFFYKLHCNGLYGGWADTFVECDVICTVLFVAQGIVGRNIAMLMMMMMMMMSHDVNTPLTRVSCYWTDGNA
jgi:hypothetical protein